MNKASSFKAQQQSIIFCAEILSIMYTIISYTLMKVFVFIVLSPYIQDVQIQKIIFYAMAFVFYGGEFLIFIFRIDIPFRIAIWVESRVFHDIDASDWEILEEHKTWRRHWYIHYKK